jgi:hypothetical protein
MNGHSAYGIKFFGIELFHAKTAILWRRRRR